MWKDIMLWVEACDRMSRGMASVPSVDAAKPTWHLMRSSNGTERAGEVGTLSVGSGSTQRPASAVSCDPAVSFVHLCKEELKCHSRRPRASGLLFPWGVPVPDSCHPEGDPNQRIPGDRRPQTMSQLVADSLRPSHSAKGQSRREETESDEVRGQQSSGTFLPHFHRHGSVIRKDSDPHILPLFSLRKAREKSCK